MSQNIKLIPLIELSTLKDEESNFHPTGTSLSNSVEWDKYQEKEIRKNYENIGQPIASGVYQYQLFEIDKNDFIKLVNLHISDMNIEDSCSLFGGYALKINDEILLYPQCCGLLEEINDWKKLLNNEFEPFYLTECHPSPKFSKVGNEVVIDCSDENHEFFPPIKNQIKVDHLKLKQAVEKLISDLTEFSNKINNLSEIFNTKNIANILIWGK